ncbi:hypothetical protein EV121DRAFT_297916 [Schizophyllum commune]
MRAQQRSAVQPPSLHPPLSSRLKTPPQHPPSLSLNARASFHSTRRASLPRRRRRHDNDDVSATCRRSPSTMPSAFGRDPVGDRARASARRCAHSWAAVAMFGSRTRKNGGAAHVASEVLVRGQRWRARCLRPAAAFIAGVRPWCAP